ncbi:hypothetical protein M8845_11920 [Gelidibacter japonicus]|uniref:hypothetical protein n=1 Tax=Gelidibacter japonicus TaxID=1962232 RepID=UPI00202219A4|nr:hypothetical protein [Gelidibacter japonicus]MCL8008134.1 hypothetical protein [Gelidibacter japonicus]
MNLSQSILSEIMQITRDIEENYPELEKYLDERPLTLPDENDPTFKVDNEALQKYLSSLKSMVRKYKKNRH